MPNSYSPHLLDEGGTMVVGNEGSVVCGCGDVVEDDVVGGDVVGGGDGAEETI